MWHLLQLYKHIPVDMCIMTRNVKCFIAVEPLALHT